MKRYSLVAMTFAMSLVVFSLFAGPHFTVQGNITVTDDCRSEVLNTILMAIGGIPAELLKAQATRKADRVAEVRAAPITVTFGNTSNVDYKISASWGLVHPISGFPKVNFDDLGSITVPLVVKTHKAASAKFNIPLLHTTQAYQDYSYQMFFTPVGSNKTTVVKGKLGFDMKVIIK